LSKGLISGENKLTFDVLVDPVQRISVPMILYVYSFVKLEDSFCTFESPSVLKNLFMLFPKAPSSVSHGLKQSLYGLKSVNTYLVSFRLVHESALLYTGRREIIL
jgi:hypothetical protein